MKLAPLALAALAVFGAWPVAAQTPVRCLAHPYRCQPQPRPVAPSWVSIACAYGFAQGGHVALTNGSGTTIPAGTRISWTVLPKRGGRRSGTYVVPWRMLPGARVTIGGVGALPLPGPVGCRAHAS